MFPFVSLSSQLLFYALSLAEFLNSQIKREYILRMKIVRGRLMVVVSDSSVLIHLARIGRFYLLRELYGKIIIPREVYSEVVEKGWHFPGSLETENGIKRAWMEIREVADRSRVREMARRCGISLGNAETIQLATELRAELALADEADVRDVLEAGKIKVRGCVGILLEAFKRNLLSKVSTKSDLEKLVESGYRVSDEVLSQAEKLLSE